MGKKKKVGRPFSKPKTYSCFKEAWLDNANPDKDALRRTTMAEGTLRPSTKMTDADKETGLKLLAKYGAKGHEVPAPPAAAESL
jgi:hypothetical protein